jgi:alkanesulfonate monooxygenase
VSEFIFSGWPTRGEMRRFCTHVLPLVRELEAREERREEPALVV